MKAFGPTGVVHSLQFLWDSSHPYSNIEDCLDLRVGTRFTPLDVCTRPSALSLKGPRTSKHTKVSFSKAGLLFQCELVWI